MLWVPPTATPRDLVAAFVADAERRGTLRRRGPTAIATATGLDRKTVRKHLAELPEPVYVSGWRPILCEYLPLRLSVPARVLASHIAYRGVPAAGEYLPTLDDYATALGWPRNRVQRALARCVRCGLIVESEAERRGSRTRKRRKPGTVSGENRVRPTGRTGYGRRGKPGTVQIKSTQPPIHETAPPNETLTAFLQRLGPMDGWSAALSQETREKLEAGAHPPSVYAVLTACGIYQNDGAKRWRFARAACARGWRTETVLGLVEAAFQPNASEGSVRAPGGLLRSWIEAPELEERRAPHLVGEELRAAQRARAARERLDLESSGELEVAAATIAATMGGIPRHEMNARARGLGAALRCAIRDLPDVHQKGALTIQLDRCGLLPELLAFAALHPELDCAAWKPGSGGDRSSSSPKG